MPAQRAFRFASLSAILVLIAGLLLFPAAGAASPLGANPLASVIPTVVTGNSQFGQLHRPRPRLHQRRHQGRRPRDRWHLWADHRHRAWPPVVATASTGRPPWGSTWSSSRPRTRISTGTIPRPWATPTWSPRGTRTSATFCSAGIRAPPRRHHTNTPTHTLRRLPTHLRTRRPTRRYRRRPRTRRPVRRRNAHSADAYQHTDRDAGSADADQHADRDTGPTPTHRRRSRPRPRRRLPRRRSRRRPRRRLPRRRCRRPPRPQPPPRLARAASTAMSTTAAMTMPPSPEPRSWSRDPAGRSPSPPTPTATSTRAPLPRAPTR